MNAIRPSLFLQRALALDAAGSLALAALQLIVPAPLARTFQLPDALLLATGAFLCAYAALLLWMRQAAAVPVWLVRLVIVGNMGWAAGCLGLPLLGVLQPAPWGWDYLVFQSVTVLLFAAFEGKGLRLSPRTIEARRTAPPQHAC